MTYWHASKVDVTRFYRLTNIYFNETYHKYPSCEWKLPEKFFKLRGQRSRSNVYESVNAMTAEEYISTVWCRVCCSHYIRAIYSGLSTRLLNHHYTRCTELETENSYEGNDQEKR